MNYSKFFILAKEAGIEQSQLYISKSKSMNVRLYHHEIETYKVNETQSVVATAIVNGKYVTARTERIDNSTFPYLIKSLQNAAKFLEKPAEVDLFEGSPKYKRWQPYNKHLEEIPTKTKLEALFHFDDLLAKGHPLVTETNGVSFSESYGEQIMMNSHGLKLAYRSNLLFYQGGVIVKQGEETKTNYDYFFGNEFEQFNPEALAEKVVKEAISKLGSTSIKTKQYPTVLSRDVFSSLLEALLGAASADEVQRHSSFLEGQLGKQIVSKKLTILENPYQKGFFYNYFDSEGVATIKKFIIKNGVLMTYFHNRETAKKDGVESTGNAELHGKKMGIGFGNIVVKPGKPSFLEMIATIKEGVYITDVSGLHSGLNPTSGDFSCQAEGFKIIDGKLAGPLSLITLSGNILKMFNDVKCLDNESQLLISSMTLPNVYIKKMNIGGL